MIESLWHNIQDTVNVEENNLIVQTLQPHISSPIHNPPQIPPTVPNPPIPMAVRFSHLFFPIVLHDLPQNYSQRISLFDGEGNFTTKQHMDSFEGSKL